MCLKTKATILLSVQQEVAYVSPLKIPANTFQSVISGTNKVNFFRFSLTISIMRNSEVH